MWSGNQLNSSVTNKKELKRIDWNIIKRLLRYLRYDGNEKKTNIAMKCHLSYNKLVLYLEWLEMMDLIKREHDDNSFERISLNDRGIEFYTRKLQDKESITN